jgi:Zn-dependent oligopeptidase
MDLPIEMLEIYSKVLGIRFVKVPTDKAVVWHPDVQLYECWDDTDTLEFSGYMYLDLHPRENKCKQEQSFAATHQCFKHINTLLFQIHMPRASHFSLRI